MLVMTLVTGTLVEAEMSADLTSAALYPSYHLLVSGWSLLMSYRTEWSTSEVQKVFVDFCNCPKHSLPITLIHGGFFPGSPQVLKVVFSFDVMIFYLSLNTASMTPVAPFRNALFECLAMHRYKFSSTVCYLTLLGQD